MGVAREVSYAVLAEAAIITALLTLCVQTGSVSLATMLAPSAGAGAALLAAGLFGVLLAENCRVPFDDPNTHLELTMVHEVMVLDHSGPPLAAILHGASLKLLLFAVLLTEAVLPLGKLSLLQAIGALIASVFVVAVVVGLVESLAGAAGFSPRAAAADDGIFAVPVRAAGRVERRHAMSGTMNLLIGLAMGLSLLALASSRLPSVIRAAAFQGMILGTLPLLLEEKFHWLVVAVAVGTITVKGFIIPNLLRRALRAANIDREVEPLLGFVPSSAAGRGGDHRRGGARPANCRCGRSTPNRCSCPARLRPSCADLFCSWRAPRRSRRSAAI